jgi:hypothetical protein
MKVHLVRILCVAVLLVLVLATSVPVHVAAHTQAGGAGADHSAPVVPVLLTDINKTTWGSNPSGLIAVNGTLYLA